MSCEGKVRGVPAGQLPQFGGGLRPWATAPALGRHEGREEGYGDEGGEGGDEDEGARRLGVAAVGLGEYGRVGGDGHARDEDGHRELAAAEAGRAQGEEGREGEGDESVGGRGVEPPVPRQAPEPQAGEYGADEGHREGGRGVAEETHGLEDGRRQGDARGEEGEADEGGEGGGSQECGGPQMGLPARAPGEHVGPDREGEELEGDVVHGEREEALAAVEGLHDGDAHEGDVGEDRAEGMGPAGAAAGADGFHVEVGEGEGGGVDAGRYGEGAEGLVAELRREGPLHRRDHEGGDDEGDEELGQAAAGHLAEIAELARGEARGHEECERQCLEGSRAHLVLSLPAGPEGRRPAVCTGSEFLGRGPAVLPAMPPAAL